jgi:hypothetical protein
LRVYKKIAVVAALALLITTFAAAEKLSGSLKNGTVSKPAAGDEVILIKLGQGMEEAARTRSDASGHFSFDLPDGGPHLIRAVHQGVTYHAMAPPGANTVEIEVFDVSKKINNISVTADVMRFQAQGNQLQGTRLFAVNNTSNPPRTQQNDQNFEFYLPDGARIADSSAETAGGQPLKTDPVPQKEKNRYAFNFPLRPGQTLFQVGFEMPYSGELNVEPKSLYATQHFVVMLPNTMQFSASPGSNFESRANPREPSATVQVASNTELGQPLGFKISGTGALTEPSDDNGGNAASGGNAGGRDSRPGGGLGPPIDAPDPLEKYRWYILGGFAAILAAGAFYIVSRRSAAIGDSEIGSSGLRSSRRSLATIPDFGASDVNMAEMPATRQGLSARPSMLLEALKEELFQLEVEHKQGSISQPEYERARAALDQTLERAIKRGVSAPKNAPAGD